MLPVYCANMAPVFAAKVFGSKFDLPLDFGYKYKGKELLGQNKTWRGLLAGIIVSLAVIYLQAYLYQFEFFKRLSLFDYYSIDIFTLGLFMGLGVILADALKSFLKRRKNIKPGDKWFFWDQLDFLGGLMFSLFIYLPPWYIFLIILLISPLLPPVANWFGFKLKIKKVAW